MKRIGILTAGGDTGRHLEARYSRPWQQSYVGAEIMSGRDVFGESYPRFGAFENDYNIIAAFYDNASPAVERLAEIGALQSAMSMTWDGKPTPDYFEHFPENKAPRGRLISAEAPEGVQTGGGAEMIRHSIGHAELRCIYLTRVEGHFECEVAIPDLDAAGFVKTEWDGEQTGEDNGVRYRIDRLTRAGT